MTLLDLPTDELTARARQVRDGATGTRVTYSPKVFVPLTRLCRDRCGYCTFATAPHHIAAPYLTPEPYRGRTNEPSYVVHTAAALAKARGIAPEAFAAATTENFFRLFTKVSHPVTARIAAGPSAA